MQFAQNSSEPGGGTTWSWTQICLRDWHSSLPPILPMWLHQPHPMGWEDFKSQSGQKTFIPLELPSSEALQQLLAFLQWWGLHSFWNHPIRIGSQEHLRGAKNQECVILQLVSNPQPFTIHWCGTSFPIYKTGWMWGLNEIVMTAPGTQVKFYKP